MSDLETRIRGVVADQLGVATADLDREISLVDDLAADSLDLVEIALAIELNLGVVLPRHFLDEVRTCGELIDATVALARRRRDARPSRPHHPVALRARLTPGAGRGWVVERVVVLTPYAAASLVEDAVRAGTGAHLELSLGAETSDDAVAWIREQFSRLDERGIEVNVRRDRGRGVQREPDAA